MEILITTFSLLTLLVIVILIGTRGKPMRFFTAFGETIAAIRANRGPFAWIAMCVLLSLGFLYFFYTSPATGIGPVQPIAFSHRLHAG
ncbi:MAG: cytochrome c family protein, partial [Desulfobacteraceae bacterium]